MGGRDDQWAAVGFGFVERGQHLPAALPSRCIRAIWPRGSSSPRFEWLVSDQAIFILGALSVCEILAEKVPVLDNVWDFLHTLLRPLAGAVASGATLNTQNVFETIVAMAMGGGLAAAAHSTSPACAW